jgi:hypothetical protein
MSGGLAADERRIGYAGWPGFPLCYGLRWTIRMGLFEIPDLSASAPEVPLHAQDAIVASMGRSQPAPTL